MYFAGRPCRCSIVSSSAVGLLPVRRAHNSHRVWSTSKASCPPLDRGQGSARERNGHSTSFAKSRCSQWSSRFFTLRGCMGYHGRWFTDTNSGTLGRGLSTDGSTAAFTLSHSRKVGNAVGLSSELGGPVAIPARVKSRAEACSELAACSRSVATKDFMGGLGRRSGGRRRKKEEKEKKTPTRFRILYGKDLNFPDLLIQR